MSSGALADRLVGATIEYVDPCEDDHLVLTFRHRGTDDDSGFLIVAETAITFRDAEQQPRAGCAKHGLVDCDDCFVEAAFA